MTWDSTIINRLLLCFRCNKWPIVDSNVINEFVYFIVVQLLVYLHFSVCNGHLNTIIYSRKKYLLNANFALQIHLFIPVLNSDLPFNLPT